MLQPMARGRSNAEIAAELYLGEATAKTVMAYESDVVEPSK